MIPPVRRASILLIAGLAACGTGGPPEIPDAGGRQVVAVSLLRWPLNGGNPALYRLPTLQTALWEARGTTPALKRLVGAGALLRPFPQEVLETCYKAANEIYADLSKSNPHFGKMHASLAAFRNDSLAWNQVAELSYDSFMMRMRTRT